MRKVIRVLAITALFALPMSLALVHAQDPTATPSGEATLEPTSDATMEMTSEPTMEMTSEVTAEATTDTSGSTSNSSSATAVPTTEATLAPTASTSGTTGQSKNGLVTCDSDLILNLYIAERYFGFSGVMQAAQAANTSNTTSFVDLTTIDMGQFTPWFKNIHGQSMMMPGMMMTQDQITNMGMMMNMDQTSMMNQMATMMPAGTDMSSLTTLTTASIAGEPQECTMLRAELNTFYNIVAFTDLQSNMGTSATGEATAEAGASTGATTSGNLTTVNFSTTMAGSQETQPADPDGTGTAAITVDMPNSQVCYNVTVQNITLPATAGHIHRGAVGVSGPPVVPFDVVPDASGNAVSCVKVDAALLNEIATNPAGFYVNIHTTDFPDGAVRGQLGG